MNKLHTWFFKLSKADRAAFAKRAYTTTRTLYQIAYDNKQLELGFADVIVALTRRKVKLDDLPLTKRASIQRAIREEARKSKASARLF